MRKRVLLLAASCIVIGLIANVSVAMACAISAQRHLGNTYSYRYQASVRLMNDLAKCMQARLPGNQKLTDVSSVGSVPLSQVPVVERFGYCQHQTGVPVVDSLTGGSVIPPTCRRTLDVAAGWPVKSLRYENDYVVQIETEFRQLQGGLLPGRTSNN